MGLYAIFIICFLAYPAYLVLSTAIDGVVPFFGDGDVNEFLMEGNGMEDVMADSDTVSDSFDIGDEVGDEIEFDTDFEEGISLEEEPTFFENITTPDESGDFLAGAQSSVAGSESIPNYDLIYIMDNSKFPFFSLRFWLMSTSTCGGIGIILLINTIWIDSIIITVAILSGLLAGSLFIVCRNFFRQNSILHQPMLDLKGCIGKVFSTIEPNQEGLVEIIIGHEKQYFRAISYENGQIIQGNLVRVMAWHPTNSRFVAVKKVDKSSKNNNLELNEDLKVF